MSAFVDYTVQGAIGGVYRHRFTGQVRRFALCMDMVVCFQREPKAKAIAKRPHKFFKWLRNADRIGTIG